MARLLAMLSRVRRIFPTPVPHQSLWQRLIRGIVFIGVPMILWRLVRAETAPVGWFAILVAVLTIPALIAALVFAVGEHYYYRHWRDGHVRHTE